MILGFPLEHVFATIALLGLIPLGIAVFRSPAWHKRSQLLTIGIAIASFGFLGLVVLNVMQGTS